ncbi:MAG: MxaK protein [Methylococcaceae bacterium]|nr:MxaK protein [Methylococcaceae bacterium]
MIRTARHFLLWALLGLSLLLAIWQALALLNIRHENSLILDLLAGTDVALNDVNSGAPELRLARAAYLKKLQRYDEALTTLGTILEQGDNAFRAKVRYNIGNIYLEQAMAEVEATHTSAAMPLVGLAKQAYRQALTLDSTFWDAKYNLEVAMRLLPEMDRLNLEDEQPNAQKSQLWTTVPGFPRGLP